MKRALFFSYIFAVLTMSVMAHAEQSTYLPVTKVLTQKESWVIRLIASRSTPCLTQIHPQIQAQKSNSTRLDLVVAATMPSMACAQVVGQPVDLTLDVRSLIQRSGLDIAPSTIYVLRVPGVDFEMSFNSDDLDSAQIQPVSM